MRLLAMSFAAALTALGCANKSTLPVATTVCMAFAGLDERSAAHVRKTADGFLLDYGFRPAQADCDVQVEYTRHGQHHGQSPNPWLIFLPGKPNLSESGVVTVRHRGKIVVDAEQINAVRATTPTDLLEMVGWEVVKPVTKMYRPPALK